MHELLKKVRRVGWMLGIALAMLLLRGLMLWGGGLVDPVEIVTVLVYKPALAAMGFVVAHLAFAQAFPYIKHGGLLEDAKRTDGLRGEGIFIGVCLLRGLIYAACILGVTLGM